MLNHLRQSIINLEFVFSEQEVKEKLKEYFSYLDQDMNNETFDELIFLISSCSSFLNPENDVFQDILDHSRMNSNKIICASFIFKELINNPHEHLSDVYSSFISGSFNQILEQIDKINNEKFIIFNHEIKPEYKYHFISNILLSTDLKKIKMEDYYTIINSIKEKYQNEKFSIYIKKVIESNLATTIPESFLTCKNYFPKLTTQVWAVIIPRLSEQAFRIILPKIEIEFEDSKHWSHDFSIAILEKIVMFHIKFKSIDKILNVITPIDMKINVWKYLADFNEILPQKLANKIDSFPDHCSALAIMPDVIKIPYEVYKSGMLSFPSFKTLEHALQTDKFYSNDVFSLPEFWNHLVYTASNEKCPDNLINKLAILFINYIKKDKVLEILEAMVFNNYSKSNNINEFLINLFYKLNDYYYDNMNLLLEKIIQKKSIQLPSFWQLFNFDYIYSSDQIDTTNPLLLLAYAFSCPNSSSKELTEVTILPQKDHSNDDLIINFLNEDNFDCIIEMNEQVLSLIISAHIFLCNNIKPIIYGLSKELILPFFAICFLYFNENENHLLFTSPELSSQFQKAIKSLSRNNSPLLIKSIDIILFNRFILFNENMFPRKETISMFNILIPLLYYDLYRANKLILLISIFDLSSQENMKNEVHDIFSIHGIKLIKYMIKNIEEIKGCDELIYIQLNLFMFDKDQIKEFFANKIQSDSPINEIRNTVYFLEYFCKNTPQITISNPSNLHRLLHESILKKNWNDFTIIGLFMNKNYMKIQLKKYADESIPFLVKQQVFNRISIEINDIISSILEHNQPEYLFDPFELLFKKLMKDPSIAINYFIFIFDQICTNNSVSPKKLLQLFSNYYKKYKYIFINAIKIVFIFDMTSKKFIRNPSFSRPPPSQAGISLISNLIDKTKDNQTKYQAFICLYNLASSFPFLFDKSIFNASLPVLSYFSLLSTVQDASNETRETIINVKASIAAFLMLHQCLNSIELLNEFVPWLFENIITFDESQIIAFTCILNSLFNIKKIEIVMLSLTIKYNFPDILNQLLKKNVSQDIIFYYRYNIFLIIYNIYQIFNTLSVIDCVLIDELANQNDQFKILFNSLSSLFPSIIRHHYIFMVSDYIKNIFEDIAQNKDFFLTYDIYNDNYNKNPAISEIVKFLKNFKKNQTNISEFNQSTKIPITNFTLTSSVIRYLAGQSYWIQQYILYEDNINFLPKHKTILSNVIEHLNSINEKQNDNVFVYNIAFKDYLLNRINNDELMKELINIFICQSIVSKDLLSILNIAIKQIAKNKISLICFLKQLNDFFIFENDNVICYDKLFQMIDFFDNDDFMYHFGVICGENFIKLALLPRNRYNSKFLSYVGDTLYNDSFIPSNITILIGLMMTQKTTEIIQLALCFCEIIGEKYFENEMPIILDAFDFALENKSYELISQFLQKIPSLGNYKKDDLMAIYYKSKNHFISHGGYKDADIICSILNSLAPERNINYNTNINENNFFQSPSVDDSEPFDIDYLTNKATPNMIESNPEFCEFYRTNRLIINSILFNDESKLNDMHFLFNFQELLDFQTRMNYFKEKMSYKINVNKEIELNVNRCNILTDSFEQLHRLEPYELLRKIKVNFIGENGIDAGGLTCEWFTLLVKEIFNSENKLFNMTDNKSYHPNKSSYENEKHIELFKFAGKIIARSLIQDQCISAHMTQSFCRQILHLPVKFKDLEDFDHDIYKSLNNILNNDVNELYLNFTISAMKNDSVEMILLKENGDNIDVTNENKKEFVNLYAEYHLKNSIIDQLNAFCEGFYSIIDQKEINYFSPAELDLLICGIPEISIADLRENTEYEYPYDDHHPVIELFYNVISEWNNDNLAKLLLFITGSSQVPVNGFSEYKNKGKPIKIIPGGEKNKFCVSHTCFNILALPEYETKDEMNEKLLISIQQSQFELL